MCSEGLRAASCKAADTTRGWLVWILQRGVGSMEDGIQGILQVINLICDFSDLLGFTVELQLTRLLFLRLLGGNICELCSSKGSSWRVYFASMRSDDVSVRCARDSCLWYRANQCFIGEWTVAVSKRQKFREVHDSTHFCACCPFVLPFISLCVVKSVRGEVKRERTREDNETGTNSSGTG